MILFWGDWAIKTLPVRLMSLSLSLSLYALPHLKKKILFPLNQSEAGVIYST